MMTRVGWPWDTTPSNRTWRNQEKDSEGEGGIPHDDLRLSELGGAGACSQEQSSGGRARARLPPQGSVGGKNATGKLPTGKRARQQFRSWPRTYRVVLSVHTFCPCLILASYHMVTIELLHHRGLVEKLDSFTHTCSLVYRLDGHSGFGFILDHTLGHSFIDHPKGPLSELPVHGDLLSSYLPFIRHVH